jgi:alcohol dehydrogenase
MKMVRIEQDAMVLAPRDAPSAKHERYEQLINAAQKHGPITVAVVHPCDGASMSGALAASLGVYSSDLTIPLSPFGAGLSDLSIVTTLCPGGKERMRRLMSTISAGRVDLRPLVTHRFKLDQIEQAYELFGHQQDGVLKVAITP